MLLYDEIFVTTSYIFLVNLVYFPILISALVREDPGTRRYEMIERWRETSEPSGTKSISKYMRAEMLKFTIFCVCVYQILTVVGLYFYAETLFSMVHSRLDWQRGEALFVD